MVCTVQVGPEGSDCMKSCEQGVWCVMHVGSRLEVKSIMFGANQTRPEHWIQDQSFRSGD